MSTNVIPMFAFRGVQLRGVKIDGETWFVAKDACACLGLEVVSSVHRSLAKLDQDEKRLFKRRELPSLFDGTFAPSLYCVSRPGLFKLIQRSNKPEAREFDRWVRHEVLPQIMDNGGYVMPDADVEKVLGAAPENKRRTDLDLMKTVMSAMQAMQERIGELEAGAVEAAPKIEAFDQLMGANGSLRLQDASRTLGWSANQLGAILRERRILFYTADRANRAYSQYVEAGFRT